ncbi:hypothetical protein [Providencia vermicola]|uniref:hypothetical protein n=1 Tax=Providencia vermicola TaxID=333965 RepID=UPI003D2AAB06
MKKKEFTNTLRTRRFNSVFGSTPKDDEALNEHIKKMMDDKLLSTWLIMTSLMASLSFAFFIGLLSVSSKVIDNSISIKVTIILFSISLSLNTIFSLMIFHAKDRDNIDNISILYIAFTMPKIRFLYGIAIFSLPIGMFSLIYYFSPLVFSIVFILSFIFLYIWNKSEETAKEKLAKIKKFNEKHVENKDNY